VSYNKFRGLGKRMRDLLGLLEYSVVNSAAGTAEYALFAMPTGGQTGGEGANSSYWGSFGRDGGSSSSSGGGGGGVSSDVALHDVFEMYYGLRYQLLKNMMNSELRQLERASIRPAPASAGGGTALDLSHYVRQSFSLLLRVIHLEFHLFETLFLTSGRGTGNSTDRVGVSKVSDGGKWVTEADKSKATTKATDKYNDKYNVKSNDKPASADPAQSAYPAPIALERASSMDSINSDSAGGSIVRWSTDPILRGRVSAFVKIADSMCALVSGELRARIIKEKSVDALCRIISTLCDDMTAQVASLRLPTPALRRLEVCLTGAVSDGLERLSYCTEVTLRREIQCFEPLPSQLAYPDILTDIRAAAAEKAKAAASGHDDSYLTLDSIAQSWYPPMRGTLSLLSKLYGVIDAGTFEDFASRVVPLCVKMLRNGADKIRRGGGSCGGGAPALLHADLFLVRHLLILREQLTPFDTRFQAIERRLDFSPTGVAFGAMMKNTRSLFKFDSSNALMQFSQNGLPELKTRQIDVRRDLDVTLKEACRLLRCSAVTLMLGPLESFLAKVEFIVFVIVVVIFFVFVFLFLCIYYCSIHGSMQLMSCSSSSYCLNIHILGVGFLRHRYPYRCRGGGGRQ
jgi:hypothetical protein